MSRMPIEPALGTIIDGKYRIEALMGKGGMGKVFQATHIQLNKTFALKLMNFNSDASDPNRLTRFRREAEALARINHPNVVMVIDFGITPDRLPYIVMEFIDGISLRTLLKSMGKIPEKQAIHLTKQICAGLHTAHVQGIVHRDLKPENIMIQELADETLMARVLDFGIAKLLQSDTAEQNLTDNQELLGTLKYITPEQFLGVPVDARSDVFGICLIAYEMLTGIVPPAVMSMSQPLHELCPDSSWRLNEIILRGLSQIPDHRQQSALELKRDLENLEHDAVVDAVRSLSGDASFLPASSSGNNTTGNNPTGGNATRGNTTQESIIELLSGSRMGGSSRFPTSSMKADGNANTTSSNRTGRNHNTTGSNRTSNDTVSSTINQGNNISTGSVPLEPKSSKLLYMLGFVLLFLTMGGIITWQFYANSIAKNNNIPTPDNKGVVAGGVVNIKGSETIGGRLAKDWSQEFMSSYPETKVLVEAKGTGTGFKSLLKGECDIAAASRPANKEEKEEAKRQGFELDSPDNEHIIGFDAIAVIVNSKNPVEHLTKSQLKDIFSGKITNWSEVGGVAGSISLFTPAHTHGTYDFFKKVVLTAYDDKLNFPAETKEIQEFSDLNQTIKNNDSAISFVTFTNTGANKVLAIADSENVTPLLPSIETVRTENYVLSRRLYLYTSKNPKEIVKKFIDYVCQPGGVAQKKVADNGFARLSIDSLPVKGQKEILTVIRFNPNSDKIDNLAIQSIQRLKYYCNNSTASEIELIGYTDSKGNIKDNVALAIQRSANVAEIMRAECANIPVKVSAMGDNNSIGDNSTEEGRRLNRRVEVWLVSK